MSAVLIVRANVPEADRAAFTAEELASGSLPDTETALLARRNFFAIQEQLRWQARLEPVDGDVESDVGQEDLRSVDGNIIC